MASDASETVPTGSSEVPAAIPYADPLVPSARETGLTSGITRGDVAALAVRIFGIYLLLNAVTVGGYLVTVAFQLPRLGRGVVNPLIFYYAVYLMTFVGVGAWFTLKASRIAAWLLPRATANPSLPAAPGSWQGMQPVAFSIVGVYLAASAFPDLAAIFAQYSQFQSDRAMFPQLIKPALAFGAGLVLFFKAKRISGYWQQIGIARPTNLDDDSGPL